MKADSVVLHDQKDTLLLLVVGNAHRLGLRVPDNVGQALLEDAEGRGGPVPIQVQIDRRNRDLAGDTIARGKLVCLPFNGGRQAQVIQNAGAQPATDIAHRLYTIIDQLDRFL